MFILLCRTTGDLASSFRKPMEQRSEDDKLTGFSAAEYEGSTDTDEEDTETEERTEDSGGEDGDESEDGYSDRGFTKVAIVVSHSFTVSIVLHYHVPLQESADFSLF